MAESRRRRLFAVAAALVVLAGCAEIRSRLPSRSPPKSRPPATTAAKPRPPPTQVPASTPFPVLAAATADREKARLREALARADADALAPGDVGYYLDVLQGRLRQVAGAQASVSRRGNRVVLDLSRGVRFTPGADGLGPGTREVLTPIARVLADYRQVQVSVRVSPVDAAANNDPALAERRALALAQHLSAAGVARQRVVVVRGGSGGGRVEVVLDAIVKGEVQR